MSKNIFEAARQGDLHTVKHILETKPDLSALNDHGFTALHCAAMGSNQTVPDTNLEILKLLVEAGSPLETIGDGGRTPLYLLAEFSPSLESVQYLVNAGANPNVYDAHGNHIVENAMMEEVQEWLSEITGVPVPPEPEPTPPSVKMSAAAWKKAKADLDEVFKKLSNKNLIVLQDAGYTQDDGFSDCAEKWHAHSNQEKIIGFCFYTRQDLNRAKRSSELPLAFWGAPEGEPESMKKVGEVIVDNFREAGFHVSWSGSGSMRPSLYLHKYSEG